MDHEKAVGRLAGEVIDRAARGAAATHVTAVAPPRGAGALFGWYSDRRLLVAKDGRQIALDDADLLALRRFLAQFNDPALGGGRP